MTTGQEIFAVAGLLIAIFVIGWLLIQRPINKNQLTLFNEKTSPSADARSLCMVKEAWMESPGVAEVFQGNLNVYSVMGSSVKVPIEQIKIIRARKNWFGIGNAGWWLLTCFRLECRGADQPFVIGVRDPKPWKRAFKIEQERRHV